MKKEIQPQTQKRKIWFLDVSYIPLIIAAAVSVGFVFMVYQQTQEILHERLRERITAIVATAVLQIDGEDVAAIIRDEDSLAKQISPFLEEATISLEHSNYLQKLSKNPFVWNHPIVKVTNQMKKIRESNQNLTYIYILEPTDDEAMMKFTTDADTAIPVDWDENGKMDEIEYPPLPGEEYDVSDSVEIISKAFDGPIAAYELYTDKWGTFLSGYAPISHNGEVVALLAIDVEVKDFTALINATLIPFSILAAILLLMLTVQTVALVRIWGSRVEVMHELDRQKDDLLSIVSHQLATPVSSAKWYMEMLLDGDVGDLSKEQKDHITTVQSVMTNLSDLVSMILDVSRIQLGRMKVDKSELNLNEFFQDILDVINPKAEERKITLDVDIPEDLPVGMLDKRLMRMTLENLLSNAVKYSDEKHGKVEFHVSVKGNTLKYFVKDNGCGIPKKDQGQIFGKLFRASNVQKVDGNGFGLYAAKGAVEAQGGKIHFESDEGKGTSFFVEVPLG